MKTHKIIAGVVTSICLLSASNFAFAAKEANFPNPKSLQPMPSPDIKPDISRNVNSENVPIPINGTTYSSDEETSLDDEGINSNNEEETSSENPQDETLEKEIKAPSSNMWVYISLILALVGLIIYIAKQTLGKE